MSDKERIVAKNRLILCPTCQKASRTPAPILEAMLPVKLTCPHCMKVTVEFDFAIPELAKIEPPQQDSWWHIEATEKLEDDDDDALQRVTFAGTEGTPMEVANHVTGFMARGQQISDMLFKGLELIYILNQDIAGFERSFYQHFSEATRLADFFFNNWNPHFLQEFVENPFVVIPIHCDDELANRYARLILSPKFIRPFLGMPIPSTGGFHLELINQYTIITKPVTSKTFREYLNIPEPIDLRMAGNKIVGSSLAHCWRDIPGILEDGGHTEDDPSVIIHPQKSAACRSWLAQHGTAGWMTREIPDKIVRREEELLNFGEQTEATVEFYNTWATLRQSGRIGIFWNDIMRSRDFAVKAAHCIKGPKVIMLSRSDDADAWQSLGGKGQQSSDAFLYYSGSHLDRLTLEKIQDIRMIVLDHLYAVNLATLRMLYDYQGILIVLCNDPFLDFNSENLRASLLYGLVCQALYDESNKYIRPETEQWERGLHWESPILAALANIRRPSGTASEAVDS